MAAAEFSLFFSYSVFLPLKIFYNKFSRFSFLLPSKCLIRRLVVKQKGGTDWLIRCFYKFIILPKGIPITSSQQDLRGQIPAADMNAEQLMPYRMQCLLLDGSLKFHLVHCYLHIWIWEPCKVHTSPQKPISLFSSLLFSLSVSLSVSLLCILSDHQPFPWLSLLGILGDGWHYHICLWVPGFSHLIFPELQNPHPYYLSRFLQNTHITISSNHICPNSDILNLHTGNNPTKKKQEISEQEAPTSMHEADAIFVSIHVIMCTTKFDQVQPQGIWFHQTSLNCCLHCFRLQQNSLSSLDDDCCLQRICSSPN